MSWFTRSIATTLNLDDGYEDYDFNETNKNNIDGSQNIYEEQNNDLPLSPGRGVKEDLSEFSKTLSRQFWGVASFLAPPPSSNSSSPSEHKGSVHTFDPQETDPAGISGIRSDFAEIGGKFRSGISKLSNNMAAVSEITKMASNFLQLGSDEERAYDSDRGAAGVTNEVVAYVRDIAMHPETWLDFPLPEDEDNEDFEMSDAQQEHALAVERLAPLLAALRIELCPGYMSESFFWKIYFVLLHPRLDQHDAEVLSTTQIVEARALLKSDIKNHSKANPEQDWSRRHIDLKDTINSRDEECFTVLSTARSEYVPIETSALELVASPVAADFETEKHPVLDSGIQVVDKSIVEEGIAKEDKDHNLHLGSSSFVFGKDDEDDADDWLKEESSEIVGSSSGTNIPIDNDEDVSFSDLEVDEGDVPISYKKVAYHSDSSTKDSRDWVQLSRRPADLAKDISSVTIERSESRQVSIHNPESKESNDWLDLDDIDVA